MSAPLSVVFYDRDVQVVAKELIGKLLCRRSRAGLTVGRIVETEAYLAAGDRAAHSFKGRNRKNASMFGPPGRAYVYTIHARQCVNVVTEAEGTASAVLIRAVKPMMGVGLMENRRQTVKQRDLCRGPARLCEAFDIGRNFDGWNLTDGARLWITDDGGENIATRQSVRIGVTSAKQRRLRFFAENCEFVSGPRSLNEI